MSCKHSKVVLSAGIIFYSVFVILNGSIPAVHASCQKHKSHEITKAIIRGDFSKVKQILDSGFRVNTKFGHTGYTPLITASYNGRVRIVKLLLNRGADVSILCVGLGALHNAVRQGNLKVMGLLIRAGADVNQMGFINQSPLHRAVEFGKVDAIRLLLKHGARVDQKGGMFKGTSLFSVAGTGNIKIAKLLLDAGANINAKSEFGDTPLHWAASYGKLAMVRFLGSKGANLNAINKKGMFPVSVAARNGHRSVCELFIKLGARIRGMGLLLAAQGGLVTIVKECLKSGESVKQLDKPAPWYRSNTALHWAATHCHTDVIRILAKAGAPLEVTNTKGQTPLCTAVDYDFAMGSKIRFPAVQAILRAGANVNFSLRPGYPRPLFLALFRTFRNLAHTSPAQKKDAISVVRLLLKSGALFPKGSGYAHFLGRAIKEKHWELVRLLRKYTRR